MSKPANPVTLPLGALLRFGTTHPRPGRSPAAMAFSALSLSR